MINNEWMPLISVIVVTYNSENFVLETLESINKQTYTNIELVIADDASSDATLELCRKWATNNCERFSRIAIVRAEKNSGIPANCNRGIEASTGEWLKIIAGDDMLTEDSLYKNYSFSAKRNSEFIISDMLTWDGKNCNLAKNKYLNRFFTLHTCKRRLKSYVRYGGFLNTPTFFFSRTVYEANNGFDEGYRLLEDKPFMIKTLLNQFEIAYLDEPSVIYRRHAGNVTSERSYFILNNEIAKCTDEYCLGLLSTFNLKDAMFKRLLKCKSFIIIKHKHTPKLFLTVINKTIQALSAIA